MKYPICIRLVLLFCVVSSPLHAISIVSQDLFATHNENWQIGGSGIQPRRVNALSFDSQLGYLQHDSVGGAGANSKWLMWTTSADWLGDYVTADITSISLWVNNVGANDLSLRIAFHGPGGWFYSTPITSIAGDSWVNFSYDLDESNFTYVPSSNGSGNYIDTMSEVERFEIFGGNSSIVYKEGGNLLEAGSSVSSLNIDQIQAIPEPSGLASFAIACCLFSWLRKRRTH